MKFYELSNTQIIKRSRSEVFPFFENPANLARITPPSMGFQILTPSPISMRTGTLIDYSLHVAGIPVRWTSLINEYDPPNRFVDVQIKGPYSFWHHTHLFLDHPDGTEIQDVVRYALPLGLIGQLAVKLFVRRELEKIFDYRRRVIEKQFEPGLIKSSGS